MVNTTKCEFNKTSVEYYSHVFSRNGISPSPAKFEAVGQAGTLSNPDEVCSLLGLAQYTAHFIVMAYYDLSSNTGIYWDASPVGLGAVLIERNKIN